MYDYDIFVYIPVQCNTDSLVEKVILNMLVLESIKKLTHE